MIEMLKTVVFGLLTGVLIAFTMCAVAGYQPFVGAP